MFFRVCHMSTSFEKNLILKWAITTTLSRQHEMAQEISAKKDEFRSRAQTYKPFKCWRGAAQQLVDDFQQVVRFMCVWSAVSILKPPGTPGPAYLRVYDLIKMLFLKILLECVAICIIRSRHSCPQLLGVLFFDGYNRPFARWRTMVLAVRWLQLQYQNTLSVS